MIGYPVGLSIWSIWGGMDPVSRRWHQASGQVYSKGGILQLPVDVWEVGERTPNITDCEIEWEEEIVGCILSSHLAWWQNSCLSLESCIYCLLYSFLLSSIFSNLRSYGNVEFFSLFVYGWTTLTYSWFLVLIFWFLLVRENLLLVK